ncbi:MAG: aspartate--tRNA ligase [Phycisphaerales bacterium]|nr:aspartate--tRNA ligase [Phycisphaerales bacterium]
MRVEVSPAIEPEELTAGAEVVLAGWVDSRREHGGALIFIDLRDREGITQLVFDLEDCPREVVDAAERLRGEDVIAVTGAVRMRDGGPNPRLQTGEVELVVRKLTVLNKAQTPPFHPTDKDSVPNEELRLKHRYLDLRRPRMQEILRTRHKVLQTARRYFDENGFLEVETPVLYKSTPEGAREFILPSRLQPGMWYALPQSPQLFKQILMVAGCDRYMQICRCFRDEDPRADRQAEFSQIDLEMSFVEREDVMAMMEGFVRRLWKDVMHIDVPPLQRMTYQEAMDRFGIDRPDTRYALEIADVSDLARRTEFGVFQSALAKKGGVVRVIRVPGGADKLTRKITDGYQEFVKTFGAGGAPMVKVTPAGFETGIAKFLEPIRAELTQRLSLQPGDVLLFGADAYPVAVKALGELRQKVARDMGLVPEWGKAWNFLWVVDFPMFARDEESRRWVAMHHPFTAPRADQQKAFVDADPSNENVIGAMVSAGYDIVLNGSEIAGGSVRIHDPAVQSKVFSLLGLSPEQAQEKFSFLLEALKFGAPPHAGIAFGLDRLIMHLCGTENIRDVIAFPKTQIGSDLMTGAPGAVTPEQLKDLHVAAAVRPA